MLVSPCPAGRVGDRGGKHGFQVPYSNPENHKEVLAVELKSVSRI